MSNTKNKNTGKKSNRKSLRGKWGHIGAPPKHTNWPSRPFTMATLFARNSKQCQLSLRKKVEKGTLAGTIVALKPIKQQGGAVGRPKSRFVMKEHFDANTMELAPVKVVDIVEVSAPVSVVNPVITPAVETPTQVEVSYVASPAPEVVQSVEVVFTPSVIESAPSVVIPHSSEPVIG